MDRFASFRIKAGLNTSCQNLTLRAGFGKTVIITANIANSHLGHIAVAVFHFANRPFQRGNCL